MGEEAQEEEAMTALMPTKPRRRMTPTHSSWRNMLGRCENPLTNGYKHYGGLPGPPKMQAASKQIAPHPTPWPLRRVVTGG